MAGLFTEMREIVIGVNDIDAATERLAEIFDAPMDERTSEPLDGIEIVQRGVWIGNERIAVVGDAKGTGPLAKSIQKRGEGLHEICVRTPDLDKAIAHFKEKGVRLTSEEPFILKNYEFGGEIFSEVRIVFIHPKSCFGIQVEVQEWRK